MGIKFYGSPFAYTLNQNKMLDYSEHSGSDKPNPAFNKNIDTSIMPS